MIFRAFMIGAMLLCYMLSAAQTIDPSSLGAFSSNELVRAALATYANFRRGAEPETADGIPSKYCDDPIKSLKPAKVYTHGFNIVVVLRVHNNVEEGKYIYNLISSSLPQDGVDGFKFTPNPQQGNTYYLHEVLDFKRSTSK